MLQASHEISSELLQIVYGAVSNFAALDNLFKNWGISLFFGTLLSKTESCILSQLAIPFGHWADALAQISEIPKF